MRSSGSLGLSDWVAALAVVFVLLSLNLATVKNVRRDGVLVRDDQNRRHCRADHCGRGDGADALQITGWRRGLFAHLWNDGGWFPKGISGFFAGFQIAVFAFVGIELVGTTAAETKDPEKSLPRAINSIPIRIIMFYVFALIVIMSVTPWSSVVADKSPFVELFVLVGDPRRRRASLTLWC